MHLPNYRKIAPERKRIVGGKRWKSAQFHCFWDRTPVKPAIFTKRHDLHPVPAPAARAPPRCREAIDSQQKAKACGQCIFALILRTIAQTPSTTTGVIVAKTTPLLMPNRPASG